MHLCYRTRILILPCDKEKNREHGREVEYEYKKYYFSGNQNPNIILKEAVNNERKDVICGKIKHK